MEMTTCEYDGDPRQWACLHDEQCDDCFMVDHLKECAWCTHYDHPSRPLKVQHDLGERKYIAVTAEQEAEAQLNQEQKWGEERLPIDVD